MPTHPSCWPPVGPSLARASLLAFALVAAACQTCGGEQTEVPTPSEPVPERLTLVTLNVLATPVRAEARTNALLAAQPTVSRRRSLSSPRTTSAFGSSSLADQSSTPTPNTTPGARPVA